ncbi:MAG: hypothetical protein N3A58_07435 [Spirochaetes bacterium]|nr:hypothetical protein [Spirochaetota bacterium]
MNNFYNYNLKNFSLKVNKFGEIYFINIHPFYIGITLDIGPRILFIGKIPEKYLNLINKNDSELKKEISKNRVELIVYNLIYSKNNLIKPVNYKVKLKTNKNKGIKINYNLIGGHRIWLSPEDEIESYIPDNIKVNFNINQNNESILYFFSNHYKLDKYFHEKGFIIEIKKEPQLDKIKINKNIYDHLKIKMTHFCKNLSNEKITRSLWGITVLNGNGYFIFPIYKNFSKLNPQYNIVFWPYNNLSTDNIKLLNAKNILNKKHSLIRNLLINTPNVNKLEKLVKVINERKKNNKFGFFINSNIAFYISRNFIFSKEIFQNDKNLSIYPDLFTNFQVYLSKHYEELETLSPIFEISNDKYTYFSEIWDIYIKE